MVYSDSSRKCTWIGVAKSYSDSSRSCNQIVAFGLLGLKQKLYSDWSTRSLCGDIMDKVMDLGNAYLKDCKITPSQQASSSSKKDKKKQRKAKHNGSK
jgi:hypothetical protein